ncbi:hypothetical protein IAI53_08640 [Thauera sp. CAU 1555]|uniref:Uncharacterized protein n=1 Tax=Thauera sedimentorum TaxID=2767595 RepID=A0ABR9B9S8_9RHOO|nr:hypothetical protein [Thauera sedimentorum]MBC9072027.1 hypothetical protein [Thauera sedimentorum]MBD8502946.1 hypothetical protein [Thauera sedimentorum]
MAFKLTVFVLILLAVAVFATRGYRNALRRFEAGRTTAGPDQGDGSG